MKEKNIRKKNHTFKESEQKLDYYRTKKNHMVKLWKQKKNHCII